MRRPNNKPNSPTYPQQSNGRGQAKASKGSTVDWEPVSSAYSQEPVSPSSSTRTSLGCYGLRRLQHGNGVRKAHMLRTGPTHWTLQMLHDIGPGLVSKGREGRGNFALFYTPLVIHFAVGHNLSLHCINRTPSSLRSLLGFFTARNCEGHPESTNTTQTITMDCGWAMRPRRLPSLSAGSQVPATSSCANSA